MSEFNKCNQTECDEPAAYRYTWPEKDEAGICEKHVDWLKQIVLAMELHLQIIPLDSNIKK